MYGEMTYRISLQYCSICIMYMNIYIYMKGVEKNTVQNLHFEGNGFETYDFVKSLYHHCLSNMHKIK